MLSLVCWSHAKAEAAASVDGRREELFWDVFYGWSWGLWLVFVGVVGVLCSSAVTIHGESTFLLFL